MTVYRYAWDQSGRAFTEAAWIESAWTHFVRLPDDSDVTFALFLMGIFAEHVRGQSIVVLGEVQADAVPFSAGVLDGCPFCNARNAAPNRYPLTTVTRTAMCLRRNAALTKESRRKDIA